MWYNLYMDETRFDSRLASEYSPESQAEKYKFVPTDALITFGRGIEQVSISGSEGEQKIWKGTRLVQELKKDPTTGRHIRTGQRKAGEPLESFASEDDLKEMAAGANANILATVQWMRLANERNTLPKEIICSGGRPAYLENAEAGISEASVMSLEFKRRLGLELKNKQTELPPVDIVTESKNTKDDITYSLLKAKEKGCRSVTIVNVSWAMERTKAFYELNVLKNHPELKDMEVLFVTSDELLVSRFGHRAELILNELKNTAAYKDTLVNEDIGTQKIKEGEYGKGHRGKGNY